MTNVTTRSPWEIVAEVHRIQRDEAINEGDEYTANRCHTLYTFIKETHGVGSVVYSAVKEYALWLLETRHITTEVPKPNAADDIMAAYSSVIRTKYFIFEDWDDEEIMTAMLSLYRMALNAHKIEQEIYE